MASSSSASPSTIQPRTYEVFLSFRGQDTRESFTSHLHSALVQKSIETFIDDGLCRGEEITTALLEVIKRSKIAVIVFSKDYASSPFCLDEVANIMECHVTQGQIVVPIFYHIDPSDVENQTGTFETAFANHSKTYSFDRIERWKSALNKAATMAGWDSKNIRPEAKLVEKIVKDTLNRLKDSCSSTRDGLVGIDSQVREIQTFLSSGSGDTKFLGICGMGGIGKTTLARVVFEESEYQFEGSCFLSLGRTKYETCGGYYLIKEFLRQTLGEGYVDMTKNDISCYSLAQRMLRKKLLIVVDDVYTLEQLEFFVRNRSLLGRGSRVIVTSRDKHLLSKNVDFLYEQFPLDRYDAMQLFCNHAFEITSINEDQRRLSVDLIEYAQGVPLALIVLGQSLRCENQRGWESALDELRRIPDQTIQRRLRISFDILNDHEKEIFLDVACFFTGMRTDEVTSILDACGFSADYALHSLMDRSLVSISNGRIKIHDLLQEMGKQIVREESIDHGRRSRLWDAEDILSVLRRNAGSKATKAICLNMSEIDDEIDLDPNVFARMSNLKLLKFYSHGNFSEGKVRLPKGLASLSNELTYLYWHGYSSKALPDDFHPFNLVELCLPHSKLERLPKEIKRLKKLKKINLSCSTRLIEILKLPRARKLTSINLVGCKRLRSFPSCKALKSLETLMLSFCSKIETFPEVPKNIKFLYLDGTAIKQVPSSVESLCSLEVLSMRYCNKLKSVPGKICMLKFLVFLDLCGCSTLKKLPSGLTNLSWMELLDLSGNRFETLPQSIVQLSCLRWLDISSCNRLRALPDLPLSLIRINAFGCTKLVTVSCLKQLFEWKYNDSSYSCSKLDRRAWREFLTDENMHFASSPEHWYMRRGIALMKQTLHLETNFSCKQFIFTNCFKLDPIAWREFLENALLVIQHSARLWHMPRVSAQNKRPSYTSIWYPGSEIPEWFTYQSEGSLIQIPLQNHCSDCRFLGVTLCLVLSSTDYPASAYLIECQGNGVKYGWHSTSSEVMNIGSDHSVLIYDPHFPLYGHNWNFFREEYGSFVFSPLLGCGEVKKCGMLPLYDCDGKCNSLQVETNPPEELMTNVVIEVETPVKRKRRRKKNKNKSKPLAKRLKIS